MAKSKIDAPIRQDALAKGIYQLFDIFRKERAFLIFICTLFVVCAIATPYAPIAMWLGFALAGYSAIANDSIQTIGTFLASNAKRPWWVLWLFMGLIFVVTVSYSWFVYDGDVSSQRLTSKGFETAPTSFSYLQLAAPIILLILTRLRMPVSTTFLLLSAFSTQADSIKAVLMKSFVGYFMAFGIAILVWFVIARFTKKFFKGKAGRKWLIFQWVTSGALWSAWISQDAANIAVYLPRSLSIGEFIGFTSYIFLGLGILFYLKGDKIQKIVNEKSGVRDVRAATIVDLIYAILLFYFKVVSTIPISTTWVFIGLLGGRELAIAMGRIKKKKKRGKIVASLKMLGRDLLYATIGLVISLILAIAINEQIRRELFHFFY